MSHIAKKKYKRIQTVIFYEPLESSDIFKAAIAFGDAFKEVFTQPKVIPFDAPADIPRLVFESPDKSKTLELYSNRISLTLSESEDCNLNVADDLCIGIVEALGERLGGEINRIGRLVETQLQLDIEVLALLKERYLNQDFFDSALRIQLGWLEQQEWEDDLVNRWIRFGDVDDQDKKQIQLFVDVNLVVDKERRMLVSNAHSFLKHCSSLVDSSINNLFAK